MQTSELQNRLQIISPSFCPLRWTYMQVDLEHGRVKACCKTQFQRIGGSEIEQLGTDAIFNGKYFQERRREMLEGIWHADCDACWTQEQLGLLSYRQLEANKAIHLGVIPEILQRGHIDSAKPKHIEFILSTLCDLKCSYCGPEFSTAWVADLKTHGPFAILTDQPDLQLACSEFRETFWEWFDSIRPSVEYVQFNGGEPLIQEEFYSVVQRIMQLPGALQIGVISNLNTPSSRLDRLRGILPKLLDHHSFRFGVSQDAVEKRAEYIRHGLRWNRFDQNLRQLLEEFEQLEFQIAPTMSALNVTGIKDLLAYLNGLVAVYGPRIVLRPSIVMSPDFLSPLVLPPEYSSYLEEAIEYLEKINRWPGMKQRLCEILEAMNANTSFRANARSDFCKWVEEYDARRTIKFATIFPELEPLLRCGYA